MPLDFPNSPTPNQIYAAPGSGTSWVWDGVKWVAGGGAPGAYLPLSGGTMTGPLNATATGATTVRSMQGHWADVANVLDFGADPGGIADSTAAFNAAAATTNARGQNKPVYVPSGQYRLNGQINLVNGQSLFGDGRGSTQLFCDGNFNMAATSVIMLQATTQSRDPGSEIRGLTITMVQNQANTLRSQMVQYPPVIACQSNCGRFKVLHCRIEGAWNGITTNGNNVLFSIWDLELGALNEGLQVGLGANGPQDFCHIHGLHFWNFGFPIGPFADGNTVAMHVGRCDGLDCTDFSTLCGQVIFDSANSATTICHFTNLKLDTDQATVTVNGGLHVNISNMYSTAGTSRTKPALTVNANVVVNVTDWFDSDNSTVGAISVPAGWLSVVNGHFANYSHGCTTAAVSGNGVLKLVNTTIWAPTAGAYTVPLVTQSGAASNLTVDGFKVETLGNASTGTAVQVNSDNVGNRVSSLNLPTGWTVGLAGIAHTRVVFPAGAEFGNDVQMDANTFLNGPTYVNNDTLTQNQSSGAAFTWANINSAAGTGGGGRAFSYSQNNLHQWALFVANDKTGSGNGGGNFQIYRYDDTGASLGIPFAITRSNGAIAMASLQASTTYANDAAAATGGVAVGQLYRNGSVVQIRIT